MKKRIYLICPILFICFLSGAAVEDSVFTLTQAKARLIKKNFYLLAAYYEIDQAEAQLIQSKVWSNPVITWNQEAYNMQQDKYFKAKNQYEVQINQSISIAGKHTNTVKLARINVALTKVQFEDVMRGLMYDLVGTYNDLAGIDEKVTLYTEILESYQRLLNNSEKELELGAISVSENIRIRSEYISVKADALDVANQRQDLLAHFRTLLQLPKDTTLRLEQRLPLFNTEFSVDSLVNRSFLLRPDLKVSHLYQEFQRQNLRLQRSLSVPDVTIGYDYDKGGNYVQQYSGLVLNMPLPVFDRNQGRIKEAKSNIKQSEVQFEYLKLGTANQVISAYNQYKQNYEGLSGYNNEYLGKLDDLNNNTKLFFQKRNISLLEFIDYQRIYTSTKIQLIELRQQYLNSVNQLNFSIGTQLIEY